MPAPPATNLRLAIVVSHPIQYYAPWFCYLAANTIWTIRVFYLYQPPQIGQNEPDFGRNVTWDINLLDGYEHEFVPNRAAAPSPSHFSGLRNPALLPSLRRFRADAVLLYGYAFQTHLRLIMGRLWRSTPWPLIFRGDSHLLAEPRVSWLKQRILSFVFARIDAFLPVGRANQDYFRRFGVKSAKLFFAPHCVDGEFFRPSSAAIALARADREKLGIAPQDRVLLFAGKFSPKKRPDLLLQAFIAAAPGDTHLVLAGDGELGRQLQERAGSVPRVHFLPFANQSAMPARYLLGDVLVLPSEGRYETWGLAVNEAMHMGRPALVSDVCGCHLDLIEDGRTGWLFPAGNAVALADRIRQIALLSIDELRAIGERASTRVANHSFAAATEGLKKAMAAVVRR